jgi:hypothetical protein
LGLETTALVTFATCFLAGAGVLEGAFFTGLGAGFLAGGFFAMSGVERVREGSSGLEIKKWGGASYIPADYIASEIGWALAAFSSKNQGDQHPQSCCP